MKEKRVDICLAKAGFHQMIVLGFGGSLFTELLNFGTARPKVLIVSASITMASALMILRFYSKASHLARKIKKDRQ
jgi:hypothetical protein